MDATEILDRLARAEGLPRAALQAASAQRAEMTPVFLAEVEAYLAREPADHAKPTLLFFVFHLLGEWREKAAYRLLARLLRCPGDEVDAILGDAVTATAHRVMAAVFDGDPQPLYDIVLDADADEFVRSAICDTLAVLVLRGELDRAFAYRFLRDAFMELPPQGQCYVWQGWQSAISALGLSELRTLVSGLASPIEPAARCRPQRSLSVPKRQKIQELLPRCVTRRSGSHVGRSAGCRRASKTLVSPPPPR